VLLCGCGDINETFCESSLNAAGDKVRVHLSNKRASALCR